MPKDIAEPPKGDTLQTPDTADAEGGGLQTFVSGAMTDGGHRVLPVPTPFDGQGQNDGALDLSVSCGLEDYGEQRPSQEQADFMRYACMLPDRNKMGEPLSEKSRDIALDLGKAMLSGTLEDFRQAGKTIAAKGKDAGDGLRASFDVFSKFASGPTDAIWAELHPGGAQWRQGGSTITVDREGNMNLLEKGQVVNEPEGSGRPLLSAAFKKMQDNLNARF